ncbi:efflux RND transporter periplasmic adaptor subunit [Azospirillum sp.]|uniref:efflux RND transporter periplasmic adaptor subunit n=1 Tax=Azospirillum sp. TaxID=34012 RepID=UPI002D754277|nr:efflux RND transporter periplasmic adaptor subunit [Azospirillum sp.]HYF89516.1 efflux RND transporter periplasmic adaptor subunit [Azospirillum sp.]
MLRPVAVAVAAVEHDVAIEARVRSAVGLELASTVTELFADHEDRVPQGAVLARLDTRQQDDRVAEAEAALGQARAARTKAEAAILKATSLLDKRRQAAGRRQELLSRGSVSVEVAQDSATDLRVAEAELALARSDLALADATVADAEARLRYESARLDRYTLAAPFEALVIARHKELGAAVNPGEPLFTLVAPDSVWALVHIDEASAGGLTEGQAAAVRLRSLPGRSFAARVVRIDLESDRVTEERKVYLKCGDYPSRHHLAEQLEATIAVASLPRAVLVPQAAVERFDGRSGMVWTVEDGRLARRKLSFGRRMLDGQLEVTGGLPNGARPVVAPASGLREGRSAEPLETTP